LWQFSCVWKKCYTCCARNNFDLTRSQIPSPWMSDKVDSGIGLSYRQANLCSLAGRYDNPMPKSTLSPLSGSMHFAADADAQTTDLSTLIGRNRTQTKGLIFAVYYNCLVFITCFTMLAEYQSKIWRN
jgi:hypothetical protein